MTSGEEHTLGTVTASVVRPDELSPSDLDSWRQLLGHGEALDSPFFRPEFTQAVARVRSDVEVTVLRRSGRPVAFFPFQRHRWRIGWPVGGRLSDFHGPVIGEGADIPGEFLMRTSGLRVWNFNHLVASNPIHRPHDSIPGTSPFMDLRGGWDAYVTEQKARSKQLGTALRKSRKLAREVGELRFQFHSPSDAAFRQLLAWKSEQLRRRRSVEVLRFPWVVDLLENLRRTDLPGFAGVLSTLHAGDRLVALHLGMRTDRVLHIWFPTYDPAFGKYSPGLVLLLQLAQACASRGIERIDFGKGPERYKRDFQSGSIALAEGALASQRVSRFASTACYRGRNWVRSSPLLPATRLAKRIIRTMRHPLKPTNLG